MVHNYCSSHFHPKTISKQESYAYKWANLNIYVFEHIFGPNNGQNGQEILFSSFSSQDHFQTGIIRLCFTKSKEICFSVLKRGFLTLLGTSLGPKKVKIVLKYFSVIFIQKTFPKRGHIPMFHCKGFRSQKGLFGPFGPCFGRNRSKWPKIIFFVILKPYYFQRGVTC